METYCCARVSSRGGFFSSSCAKKASVERDGQPYCGTHDPVKVKERRAKAYKKWEDMRDTENKILKYKDDMEKFRDECVKVVRGIAKSDATPKYTCLRVLEKEPKL